MNNLVIYTKDYCPYCKRAKQLLTRKNITFEEIDVTHDADLQQEMIERSQRRTVPQIFIGSHHVGGNDDLVEANRNGQLDALLAGDKAA